LIWTNITKEIHGVEEDYTPNIIDAINFYKKGKSRTKISSAVNLAIEKGIPWDLKLMIETTQGKETWIHTIGKSNYREGICTKVYGTVQEINKNMPKPSLFAKVKNRLQI